MQQASAATGGAGLRVRPTDGTSTNPASVVSGRLIAWFAHGRETTVRTLPAHRPLFGANRRLLGSRGVISPD